MTMGALHDGHAELIRQARAQADSVIVTIFVNPLQFGAGEDLDRYPRTLDADLAVCEAEGADLVFTPTPEVVYPTEALVRVSAGRIGDVFEGASRPGHFDGVLTVVLKLLHLTRPDVALFGQKDAQQLAAIRRMVSDLDVPVRSSPCRPSASRTASPCRAATATSPTEQRGVPLCPASAPLPTRDVAAGRALFDAEPGVDLDYLERVDAATFEAAPDGDLIIVAATVGTTRLIDNLSPSPGRLMLSAPCSRARSTARR